MTFSIEQFQAQAHDWEGKPLTVDGQLGPRTRWALAIADLPRVRRDVVRIACAEVGQREEPAGSNRGPRVDVYLAPTGLQGVPWCAAFCCWVLRQAGVSVKYTASARQLLEQFAVRPATPQPGDLFGWVNLDGTGHVGLVAGVSIADDATFDIATCEGNSADRVRNCRRPQGGLTFRSVGFDVWTPIVASSAVPLVQRQTEGTR